MFDLFLLEWLAKEETSALGECDGKALERLVERGFAVITPPPCGKDRLYSRVSLTDKGRAEMVAAMRRMR